ncbi:hypothetical protein [Proteus mirabilis]|uniref:hypothetical protein n=1 Tax=Proteus mirabilis TaxID=584 RepID=UPI001F408C48|nr:hypothetical protein [Proteus mirabilis]
MIVIDGNNYIATDGNTNILLGITNSDDKLIELNKPMQFSQVEKVGEMQKLNLVFLLVNLMNAILILVILSVL